MASVYLTAKYAAMITAQHKIKAITELMNDTNNAKGKNAIASLLVSFHVTGRRF